MPSTTGEPASTVATKRAALYLRVSSVGQVHRENDPEGYSIPAQRDVCQLRAKSLGATVEHEYVDYAESARSADRPQLQRMLRELRERRIDLVVVYDVSRLARDELDAMTLLLAIQQAGARLESVAERIDDSPAGRLTYGVLAAVNAYRSRGDAEKVQMGLSRKHENGGTPFEAPTGYINVRSIENGREIRTVAI